MNKNKPSPTHKIKKSIKNKTGTITFTPDFFENCLKKSHPLASYFLICSLKDYVSKSYGFQLQIDRDQNLELHKYRQNCPSITFFQKRAETIIYDGFRILDYSDLREALKFLDWMFNLIYPAQKENVEFKKIVREDFIPS